MRHLPLCLGLVLFASPALAQTAPIAGGAYECWANGSARMLLNFSITGPSSYRQTDGGKTGSYRYTPATKAFAFTSGPLQGIMPDGFTAIYEVRNGTPTVSYRGRSGFEASFCEKAK